MLSLGHWFFDIESQILRHEHCLSDIESVTWSLMDLTNRSISTFARQFLITCNLSWDVYQTWSSMMIVSVPCHYSSCTNTEESLEWPPPHPWKPHQIVPERKRPQWSQPQSQQLHPARRQCSHHQQNIFYSQGTSSSIWEDVECKLRSDNFRRLLNPRSAFQPAFKVTWISDDRYRCTMGVIVISLATRLKSGETLQCTSKCRRNNVGITSKLWQMTWFLLIFIQKNAGVVWGTPDVYKQLIPLNSEDDAWIIVHYHIWLTSNLFLQHYILCLATLWNQRKWQII